MHRRDFLKSLAAASIAVTHGNTSAVELPPTTGQLAKAVIPKHALGRTGVEVSVLAIGGVAGMQQPPSDEFNPAELANTALDMGITYLMVKAIEMYEFDTILTTFNPTKKRRPYRDLVLPVAREKNMGIQAMKVMGGGLGSLASGNPIKNDGKSNHDEATQQSRPEILIRYVLGLPISVAVVGMSSLAELRRNVRAARDLKPLSPDQRHALEESMA